MDSVGSALSKYHILDPLALTTPGGFQKKIIEEAAMFDKSTLDAMFEELRDEYELEPDWEDIQRAAHLGVARSDAGVPLGDIDSRVIPALQKYS